MQFVYDEQADAVAIWFKGVSPCRTIDLAEDIFMDVDEDGKLAGIEVLHASEKTNLIEFSTISIKFPDDRCIEVSLPDLIKK
jgi:uncharacterized protein YuzE